MESIHLQGVGNFIAKRSEEIVVGDVTVWNDGLTETILGVVRRTPTMTVYSVRSDDGTTHERKMKNSRLVAYTIPRKKIVQE